MRKRLFYFWLLCLSAAAVMTGCEKKEDSANDTLSAETEQELVYVPFYSEYELSYQGETYLNSADNIFLCGNRMYTVIYGGYGATDSVYVVNLTTGEQTRKELSDSRGAYFKTSKGFAGYFDTYKILRIYDEEFNKVNEIELKDLSREMQMNGKRFSCEDIVMDSEGHTGIMDRNGENLFILDKSGSRICSFTPPRREESFDGIGVTEDGRWYVFCNITEMNMGNRKASVYRVDIEGEQLEWEAEIEFGVTGAFGYNIYPSGKSFYIVTTDRIYRYVTETALYEEVFCLRDYGINMDTFTNGVRVFGVLEDGKPAVIMQTDYAVEDQESRLWRSWFELCTLTGMSADEVQPRKELVIASMTGIYNIYEKPLLYFNRYNSEYYVTVKTYAEMEEMQDADYEELRQLFYNDLILGKGADIFYFSPGVVDFGNLGDKGAVADLYEFMDADEDIGREDFIPSVISAMEYNGKLYAVAPYFRLRTLVGKASLLDRYSEWDFNAMYHLAESYPDSVLFGNSNPDSALSSFVAYCADLFYDTDTGRCEFDSQEFVKLLETAQTLSREYDKDIDDNNLLQNEEILLYTSSINKPSDLTRIEYDYFGGEDIRYAGYPCGGGNGSVISFEYQWAVNAQSENTKGAWDFIKVLFAEDIQKQKYSDTAVIEKYFDEAILEDMQTEVWGVEKQGILPTEAQEQTFRELVYTAAIKRNSDASIYTIITEEAQAFFAGQKTAEEVAALIQNRALNYVEEKK